MLIFALSLALRIAGPPSFPRARPRPTNPSRFPTTHVIAKFTRRPESVIRWTMFTSRTSSSSSGRRMSTISGSRTGNPVARASSNVVTSPFRTSLPSFVFGFQSANERGCRSRRSRTFCPRPPISGPLHLRLRGFEPLRGVALQVRALDAIGGREHRLVVGDRDARVEEAFEHREQSTALRRVLPPEIEDRGRNSLRGGPPSGEISGEVRGGEVPRGAGPAMLPELVGDRGREDPVPSIGVLADLDDDPSVRLPHDDPRGRGPEELEALAVVRPALPPAAERPSVGRAVAPHGVPPFR